MSIIGPRPGLWNQDVLTAERDKYGANDVKPGLTGWAQINGRDELEIPEKAKLDGYYVQNMGFKMDGVDYIFHAAALKQVPSCEFFPMEAVKTNIIGTDNVLTAAIEEGVEAVICLSTDKHFLQMRSVLRLLILETSTEYLQITVA